MKWKPTGTKVCIRIDEVEESDGAFQFTERMQKELPQGVIVAVGDGTKDEPMEYKVGQRVLYIPHSNAKHHEGGKDYIFVEQNDIAGVSGE